MPRARCGQLLVRSLACLIGKVKGAGSGEREIFFLKKHVNSLGEEKSEPARSEGVPKRPMSTWPGTKAK